MHAQVQWFVPYTYTTSLHVLINRTVKPTPTLSLNSKGRKSGKLEPANNRLVFNNTSNHLIISKLPPKALIRILKSSLPNSEDLPRHAAHLIHNTVGTRPHLTHNTQGTGIQLDLLLEILVIREREERCPAREMDDRRAGDDACEEVRVFLERSGKRDELGDGAGGVYCFGGVDVQLLPAGY
jgi:hypothetical protein